MQTKRFPARALAHGLELLHLPIPDVSAPASLPSVRVLVGTIDPALAAGKTVVVHCRGGLGRSGRSDATVAGKPSDRDRYPPS